MATCVDSPDAMPDDALRLCVRIAVGEVVYASQQVASLPASAVERDGHLHPWILVRQQAVELLARVSKMALDVGVVEREAEIARLSGDQVASALRASLAGLALSPDQEQRLRSNIDEHLRVLEEN